MTTMALSIESVSQCFGSLFALKNISMRIEQGERRVLLGTNGAGKTTLFNIIAGDFRPTTGTIGLFGQDVTRSSSHRHARKGVTRTYQIPSAFGGLSVRENLFIAARAKQGRRFSLLRPPPLDPSLDGAQRMAKLVGLAEVADEKSESLSHGQRRQLEIGMALVQEPAVLLLDEPAAGLSPAERPMLIRLIQSLPPDLTIVMIEHDMDVALMIADQVTVMRDGEIIAEGTPAEIRENAVVQAIYLGTHHVQ